ncbi:hypothetical protein B0J11DRAFT_267119 [Dendryphion nanum]|uniref:Uncharacterized protein n=1 Tax=Dendryphion nanum TaxID=256645 RepID=A0A9P9DXP6_9PLEO|nr:hypothetical protein B0J11DRAFT_267119 [Dendryphion nanum]
MGANKFVVFVISILLPFVATECFYPDGKVAPGLIPCNASAAVSHCCRPNDICLSNGLCFSTGLMSAARRGCTSSSFNSSGCPNICTAKFLSEGDALVTPCGTYNRFCCGQDKEARACCDSGNGSIAIPASEATLKTEVKDNKPTVIGLSVALGIAGLLVLGLAYDVWRRKKIVELPLRDSLVIERKNAAQEVTRQL